MVLAQSTNQLVKQLYTDLADSKSSEKEKSVLDSMFNKMMQTSLVVLFQGRGCSGEPQSGPPRSHACPQPMKIKDKTNISAF